MKQDDLNKYKDLIYKLGENHTYPITAKLLIKFFEKIESISSVISNFNEQTDIYPCMILVRSQIEHLMVIYYIWMKNRITKSEQAAIDYNECYRTSEFLKQENYKISIQKIQDSSYSDTLIDRLLKHDSRVEGIDNTIINEIHVCASQFKERKIADFIVNEVDDKDKFALKDKMIKFIGVYNWISSFTHGGPMADILFFNEIGNKKFSDKLEEYKSWSARIIFALIILIFWFYGKLDEKLEKKMSEI